MRTLPWAALAGGRSGSAERTMRTAPPDQREKLLQVTWLALSASCRPSFAHVTSREPNGHAEILRL